MLDTRDDETKSPKYQQTSLVVLTNIRNSSTLYTNQSSKAVSLYDMATYAVTGIILSSASVCVVLFVYHIQAVLLLVTNAKSVKVNSEQSVISMNAVRSGVSKKKLSVRPISSKQKIMTKKVVVSGSPRSEGTD